MLRTYDIHLTASLTSREKPIEEEIKIDKKIDRDTRSKQEVVFFLPRTDGKRRRDKIFYRT
ncbi:MAG: hypothetical protein WBF33_07210 [Candidatus Nitrosopolaris sp.]|jgi:hypothetical protein